MGEYNILPRKNEPAIVKKLTKVLPSFPSKMTDLQENQQMSSLSQSKVNKGVTRIFLPLSGILLIITQTSHLVRPSKNVENTPKIELFTMSFSAP